MVDGAVRKCPLPSQVWRPEPQGAVASANPERCNPFGPRVRPHSVLMQGVQSPIGELRPITIHADCSRWVEERYRLCADLTEEEAPRYNVMLASNGTWSASRFVNREPQGSLEGAFLHLQRWKGEYKRLTYGQEAMAPLNGRRLFKLSRFGVSVFDADYDDAGGVNTQSLPPVLQDTDLADMNDDEFEHQLAQLWTAATSSTSSGRSQRRREAAGSEPAHSV